jgi:raffinose/stachyose/melibiose transport system substrate-binding protein
MKKKRILSMISALSMVFLLAGCGSSANSASSSSNSSSNVVVDVFNVKVETKDQLDNLVKKYEDSHPGVTINVTTVGGGQDAPTALQAKFSSGDEPAIFLLGGLSDAKKWQDKLLDVSDMDLTKKSVKGTLDGITLDNKVYGLPMTVEGYGWLVNKDIFQKAGVPIENIKSFADFENAVKTIDSKKSELGLKAVFGFSAKESWVVEQYSSNFLAPEFNNNLQDIFTAKQISYKYGDDFKKYTDLMNKYNVQPILSLDYSTSVEQYFANNQVAIIHQGNWIVPTLDSLDPNFAKTKLGIIPMFVNGQAKIAAGPSWYWGINKTKDQKVVQASKDFLTWMYTDKDAMKSLNNDFKYIPAYTNFNANDISDPLSKEIYQYLNDGKTVPWAHTQYPDGWAQTKMYVDFQKYLNGSISWQDFETTSEKEWADMRK